MSLCPDDFAAFFREVHAREPFPWQRRLARQVAEGAGWPGGWPALIDLPTAVGKTACLDIALFHLALEAGHGPDRRAALRIALVVDRRLVVDQAFERARRLAACLAQPPGPVTRAVAAALAPLAAGADAPLAGSDAGPLDAIRLRGGMPLDPSFLSSPARPALITATVDQLGSRLLFRGYGVSQGMRPVHAGLLGEDCLILLDEAHLARPFAETVAGLGRWAGPAPRPVRLVRLSATPAQGPEAAGGPQGAAAAVFRLEDEDRAHPLLSQRLTASKPARLEEVDGANAVEAFARAARDMLQRGRRRIAVVVNRVALARAIFAALTRALTPAPAEPPASPVPEAGAGVGAGAEAGAVPETAAAPPVDLFLMIGRVRPIDRDRIARAVTARCGVDAGTPEGAGPQAGAQDTSAREMGEGGRAVIVVATQTIEVGADLDFDALVTQAAPLDSLRQRFGRLDRLGRRGATEAVILALKEDSAGRSSKDPVYGAALGQTWKQLNRWAKDKKDGQLDFGIAALAARPDGTRADLCPQPASAPLVLPAYVDLWRTTSPPPHPDPDVPRFLHGHNSAEPEVRLVWRADLRDEDLSAIERDEPGAREAWVNNLRLLPPSPLEALSLPRSVAWRWLAGAPADVPGEPLADLEGRAAESAKGGATGSAAKAARAGAKAAEAEEDEAEDDEPEDEADAESIGEAVATDGTDAGATARGAGAIAAGGRSLAMRAPGRRGPRRRPLLWHGADGVGLLGASADDLPAEATLVLPASWGGCDGWGWAPDSAAPVADRAHEAQLAQRRRAVLRVTPELVRAPDPEAEPGAAWSPIATLLAAVEESPRTVIDALIGEESPLPPAWHAITGLRPARWRPTLTLLRPGAPERGVILAWKPRLGPDEVERLLEALRPEAERLPGTLPGALPVEGEDAGVTEGDAGLGGVRPVLLAEHLETVARWARRFAEGAGLKQDEIEAVVLAARLHDLGKAEARFQTLLHGGDSLRAEAALEAGRLRAKSGTADPARREAARRLSGLPRGARHECWSVPLAEAHPEVAALDEAQRDLVLYLIGSHHGHGRPFFPAGAGEDGTGDGATGAPREVVASLDGLRLSAPAAHGLAAIGGGWAERFARLNRRHGPWRLALLEAVLRLADHAASDAEERAERPPLGTGEGEAASATTPMAPAAPARQAVTRRRRA